MQSNSSHVAHGLSNDSPPRFPNVPAAYRALFVQQIDDDIAVLDQLRTARGEDALHRWLHRLSGGLAIFGPSMLLDTCKALRHALSNAAELDMRLVSLRTELIAMRDQLHATQI